MLFEYEEIVSPRNDDQRDVIDFIAGLNKHSDNLSEIQLFIVKGTGFGKTYCTGVGISKYATKTLIIVHRETLREQWAK